MRDLPRDFRFGEGRPPSLSPLVIAIRAVIGEFESLLKFSDARFREAKQLLFGDSDYATCNPCSGIARRLGFEIIRFGMDDDGMANHRSLVISKGHVVIHVVHCRLAGSVGLNVPHIAGMPFRRVGRAV